MVNETPQEKLFLRKKLRKVYKELAQELYEVFEKIDTKLALLGEPNE